MSSKTAAKLVLVHSPLVGSAAWDPVTASLAGRGYQVSVPHLAGTVTAGPPYVARQPRIRPPGHGNAAGRRRG